MGDANIKSVELLFTKPNGCVGLNKSIEFFVTFDVVLSYKHTHTIDAFRKLYSTTMRQGFDIHRISGEASI